MADEPKGWRRLVNEAIERIVKEEINRQLEARFPTRKDGPGFSYEARRYVEDRFTAMMKDDPEINAIIRDGLIRTLREGFSEKKD